MAGKGTLILATDYNALQSNVALILGSGTGNYGYGQSVSCSQVSTNAKISVSQWNNLRSDLLRCIHHQTNLDYSNYIPTASTTTKITSENFDAYKAVSDYITTTRLAVPLGPGVTPPPPTPLAGYGSVLTGQATRETLNLSQRTSSWNTVVTHTLTVTFAESGLYAGTYNSRYFFNSGGRFEISASRIGGSGGLKNSTWTTLLQNMGTIYFDYDTTSCTGTGSFVSNIGFYDLTTSDQVIFEKNLGPGEAYYPNKYYITARVNNTSTRSQIVFTIGFADDSTQPNPPWGTDELVDGTLTSQVQIYRATGTNVIVTAPTVVSSGL